MIRRDNALDPLSGPVAQRFRLVNFKFKFKLLELELELELNFNTNGPEIGHVTAKPHSVCVSHREGLLYQEVLWA